MQFSFSRFLLLLRKQFAEHGRLYALGLVALTGLWTILLVLIVYQNGGGIEVQHLLLGMGLVMGGIVFAQHLFHPLANAPEAIRYLHLPASSLEKVAAALFCCLFVFFPVVLAAFYTVDYPIVTLAQQRFSARPNILEHIKILPLAQLKPQLLLYVMATAVATFGSVYFRRYAFIKTALLAIALAIGIELLNQALLKGLIAAPAGVGISGEMFENVILNNPEGPNDLIELPDSWKMAFSAVMIYGLPVFCWVMSWVRLRETEV